MTHGFRRIVFWFAIAGAGCLVVVLLLLRAEPQPQPPDLLIAGQPQMTNGVMLINIVLSNGTSRTLNIVDDRTGNPFMVLDTGTVSNMPGTIGFGLGYLANSLKLNLAPGATLTNSLRLTNPPPRFQLLVEVRDMASEPGRALMEFLRLLAAKATLRRPATAHDLILLARSPWIANVNISNSTQNVTERPKEAPTNSLSQ